MSDIRQIFQIEFLERRSLLSASPTVLDIPEMQAAGLSAQKYVSMGDITLAELDALSSGAGGVSVLSAADPAGQPAPSEQLILDYPELLARGLDHQKFVTMGHITLAELDRQSSGAGDVGALSAASQPPTSTILDIPDMISSGRSAQKYVSMGDITLAELDRLSSGASADDVLA